MAAIDAAAVALPNDARNAQNLDRAEEMVRKGISYRLSIVPMKTPMVPLEVTEAICKLLRDNLGKSKPSHVQLVQASTPTLIIEESDLGLAPASQPATQPADGMLAAKLADTDLALLVDITANPARRTSSWASRERPSSSPGERTSRTPPMRPPK